MATVIGDRESNLFIAGDSNLKYFRGNMGPVPYQVVCRPGLMLNLSEHERCQYLILKGEPSCQCLRMLRTFWRIRLAALSLSRYGVRYFDKFRTLWYKASQNDIRAITKKKFSIEKAVPVLEELNATGDNKVILWYVRKFCNSPKFTKIWNTSVRLPTLQTSSWTGTQAPYRSWTEGSGRSTSSSTLLLQT